MSIILQSPAFKNNEPIPSRYTCDGENISPALNWDHLPEDTRTITIVVHDPDAPSGNFIHWIIYDIPVTMKDLQEGITSTLNLPDGAAMGTNDARRIGYYGPCPPSGVHHYHFTIYAVNTFLRLDAGATRTELMQSMKGHILEEGKLVGTYKRQK